MTYRWLLLPHSHSPIKDTDRSLEFLLSDSIPLRDCNSLWLAPLRWTVEIYHPTDLRLIFKANTWGPPCPTRCTHVSSTNQQSMCIIPWGNQFHVAIPVTLTVELSHHVTETSLLSLLLLKPHYIYNRYHGNISWYINIFPSLSKSLPSECLHSKNLRLLWPSNFDDTHKHNEKDTMAQISPNPLSDESTDIRVPHSWTPCNPTFKHLDGSVLQ